MRLLVFALALAAPTSSLANATVTRLKGAPEIAVDGVAIRSGGALSVKAGAHRVRVKHKGEVFAGEMRLRDGPYVFRANPCSGYELLEQTQVDDPGIRGLTLVAQAATPVSVNERQATVAGSKVIGLAASAMCAGAPVWLKVGEQTSILFLFAGQHAIVDVDADVDAAGGPSVDIVQASPALIAACATEPRIAVVENAESTTPRVGMGLQWAALLRGAGCQVVRGPDRARHVATSNTLFARAPAPQLGEALGAIEAPLTWASDVDVVFAVATPP